MLLLLLLLCSLLVPGLAVGATINATSCALSDVQAAVDAAAVGDVVHLPTCVQTTWTSTVTINKRIILEGNGTANTILNRSAVAASFFGNPMFRVTGVTGFEMRELTLDGTQDTNPNEWQETALWLEDCVDFRIHHLTIRDFAQGILADGDPTVQRGLIDHNTFTDNFCSPSCGGSGSLGYAVHVLGTGSYPALSLGTAQNVFVEDNVFNGSTGNRHTIASNNGARYVFRYNDIQTQGLNAAAVDMHGRVTSWTRGTRQYEVYHNTINTNTSHFVGIGPRGGDGVIFNNVIGAASSDRDIHLMNDYVHNNTNNSGCAGTYPMPTSGPTTTPVADQIREVYLWGNTRIGGGAAQINVTSTCASYIQSGRDYFTVARPGYVAYTYPHPLQGVTPTPDSTSNLRLHLKFDEGTGPTAEDSTANNHDGTLVNGATWGAAQMGASAVVLDGTDDEVQVSGLLSAPAAITLAAWVLPTSYGTAGAEVISVGNVVTLRVNATQILAHYWNGTAFTTLSATRPTTAGWHHVAYTATAGTQRLYVNGGLVASGSASASLSYTGQGSNTRIGTHGNAGTTTRFGGSIDDVRVYTRVLSDTDIAGLADLDDPPVLAVQITTPTLQPTVSTTSALLAGLGGIASDATGVTSVTWDCSTCTPTSAAALCTPACGAATTFTNWVIPSLTLGLGANLITVTAADASGTATDQITVTLTAPPAAAACTHYASPAGGGNGLSQGSPFQVVQFWALATPTTVLCLLDGTYTGGNSMIQPPAGLSGTASQPITVRALNDGAALLDGEHARNPVVLGSTNTWFSIEGVNARNGLTVVYEFLGNENRGKRLVGWNGTSGQANTRVFTLRGLNSVIEDCAGWGDNARIILGGSDSSVATGGGYRRCFFEWNDHPTGTVTSGKGLLSGRGQRYENIIGTVNKTGD